MTTLVVLRANLGASTDASALDAMPDAIDPATPRTAAVKTMRAAPPLQQVALRSFLVMAQPPPAR
jgi:hypothetical protein